MAERYCGPARRALQPQIDPRLRLPGPSGLRRGHCRTAGEPVPCRHGPRGWRDGGWLVARGEAGDLPGGRPPGGRGGGGSGASVARRRAVLEAVTRGADGRRRSRRSRSRRRSLVSPARRNRPSPASSTTSQLPRRPRSTKRGAQRTVRRARRRALGALVPGQPDAGYVRTTAAALPHLRASRAGAASVNVASTARQAPVGEHARLLRDEGRVLSYSRLIADPEGVAMACSLRTRSARAPTATPATRGGQVGRPGRKRSGGSRGRRRCARPGAGSPNLPARRAQRGHQRDRLPLLRLACGLRLRGRLGRRRRRGSGHDLTAPRGEHARDGRPRFLCWDRVSYVSGAAWGVDRRRGSQFMI